MSEEKPSVTEGLARLTYIPSHYSMSTKAGIGKDGATDAKAVTATVNWDADCGEPDVDGIVKYGMSHKIQALIRWIRDNDATRYAEMRKTGRVTFKVSEILGKMRTAPRENLAEIDNATLAARLGPEKLAELLAFMAAQNAPKE